MMRQVAATSIVVFKQGCFLLIKRKYAPYQDWLSFPGGKVEPHETAIEAARRELYEETSLVAEELELLHSIDLHDEGEAPSSSLLNVYHALSTSGTLRPGDDASAAFWLSFAQMQQQQVIPSVLRVAKAMMDKQQVMRV